MQLLPRLCMATGTGGDGDGEVGNGGNSSGSSSKLGTAVSSSSSTVSTSSAAAAAVSEASSSSTSLPSLPSLSSATSASLAASFAHVTTLLPLSASSSAAAVVAAAAAAAAAGDSIHGGGLIVVARPACVALHDLSTMEATSTSDAADDAAAAGSVKCVAHLQGGGGVAVTGHQDGRLRLWRVSSRTPGRLRLAAALPTVSDRLRRFPVPSNHVTVRRHHRRLWIEHADAVSGVAASADGRLLFSVSWDKTLKVWALPSLRCLQSLPAHDDAVNAVAVAPDGTVYTASADKRVRVWAPAARPDNTKPPPSSRGKKHHVYHLVATLSRHTAAVNALAVGCGGHGQAVYSGGNDRCVVAWEREDSASHMAAVGALRGHRRAVLSVACAPGGLVVSGSADQTVRAWRRAADGRGYACVAVIDGAHDAAVRSVAAAAVPPPIQKRSSAGGDGGEEEWKVCSASFDGEVRVWSLRVSGL